MTMARRDAEPSTPAQPGGIDFREKLVELIPFLRAFACSLSGHRDRADDLCQEALTKAWRARATFAPGTNLKAWLFMILRNQFFSDARRAWRQKPWDEGVAEVKLVSHASQESSVVFSELVRAMRLLPNEQREALILVGAGGFAYAEAAKICGCAIGTIKSRVARARQRLEGMRDGTGPRPQGAVLSSSDATNDIAAQLDVVIHAGRKRARLAGPPKPPT